MLYYYLQLGHKIVKTDSSFMCTKGFTNLCTHLIIVYQVYALYHGTGSICLINKLYFQVEYFVLNAPGSLQVTDWIIILQF
jgi:hypothetical protein